MKKENQNNKFINFIINNYVYLCITSIATIVFVVSLVVYDCYPFGTSFPLNGNGYYQSYTFFIGVYNAIRSDHAIGLINYSTGILSDYYYIVVSIILQPWKYILYLLIPESLNIYAFLFEYLGSFVLSGLSFVFYLTHRKNGKVLSKNSPILIVFGLAYCLSAYTICFFVYLNFYFMPLVPIIFLGIEQLVYEKKILLYIISLFYIMATDAYYAFICCIFVVLYFLIQNYKTTKEFINSAIRFAYSSMIAAGLSAAFLIPYYYRTANSPYNSGDSSRPGIFEFFDNIFFQLSEIRTLRNGVITTQVEARVNLYCGLLMILLVPAFFMLNKISIQEKIKRLIVILITYLAFDNRLLNYVFHGFHYQWQVPNRFSFFLIFILLQCSYDVIVNLEDLQGKSVFYSCILAAVLLLSSYSYMFLNNRVDNNEIISYIVSSCLLILYGILLCFYVKQRNNRYIYISLFVLSIELIISSVISFESSVSGLDFVSEEKYINDVKSLTSDIDDIHQPFVFTERPGEMDNQNFSFLADVKSLSYYSSASSKQQADLLYRWGVLFSNNITYYSTGSPVSDMILHVKYHIVNKNNIFTYSEYPVFKENDNIQICKNDYALPLGIVFGKNSMLDDYNTKSESFKNYDNAFDRDNDFAKCFNIGNIYNEVDITRINEITDELNTENNYYIKDEDEQGNGYYSFLMGTQFEGDVYIQIANSLEYIGTTHKDSCDTLYYMAQYSTNLHEDKITVCILNKENLALLYNVLSSNTMQNAKYNLNSFEGQVDSSEDGILYFAMPDMPGVTVYIDGQKQEKLAYLDGVAVNITKGVHDIKIIYVTQGLKLGIIISCIFILILLIICLSNKLNKETN